MKYNYIPVKANQPDNPFWRITPQKDTVLLQRELEKRLHWVCELGASKTPKDQEVYAALTQPLPQGESAHFGKSGTYGWRANTGIGSMAGAIEKLHRGDISAKQAEHIHNFCKILNTHYPNHWSMIEFEEGAQPQVTTTWDSIFEQIG